MPDQESISERVLGVIIAWLVAIVWFLEAKKDKIRTKRLSK